jgi:solute carrier family 25 carnitine/acylcarnitine transporter 20/29
MTTSSSLWQDLIAGGIAGTAGVVIGHPFDTIKVRLQQQQQQIQQPKTKIAPNISNKPSLLSLSSSSILRGNYTATHAVNHPNNLYRGLYRGIGAPFVTAALINASVFCVYGSASRMWDNHYYYYYHSNSNNENSSVSSTATATTTTTTTITKHAVCGLITGMITSLLLCPVEHVKIRLQTLQQQGSSSSSSPSHRSLSSFDVAKQIILRSSDHGHGGLKGIYRGLFVTCLRQGPSFAIYFPVYHILKDVFSNSNSNSNIKNNNKNCSNDNKDPSSSSSSSSSLWWSSALAGGCAGSLAWTIVYPIDVIKSRIQSLPIDTPSKKRSLYYIARNIYRNEGGFMTMILSRGLAVTILRAFPVNGTIFFVYEYVNQRLLLNNNNNNNNSNNIGENYNREATTAIVGDQEYSGMKNNHNHNIPRRRFTLRVLDVDVDSCVNNNEREAEEDTHTHTTR